MTFSETRSSFRPNWAAEAIDDRNIIPGGANIDAAPFPFADSFTVTVTAAAAAGANVSIAVSKLERSMPAGTGLNFGGGKLATLISKADDGATTIRATLAAALTGNETAQFAGISGQKVIKAGTLVGRTWAERDANVPYGVAVDADEDIYLLAFDVENAIAQPDCALLRHNTLVRDALLPGWAALSPALKAKVRSLYECVKAPTPI